MNCFCSKPLNNHSVLSFRKDHEKCEFDVHEVYGIDVLVSTGEGKVNVYQIYSINLIRQTRPT